MLMVYQWRQKRFPVDAQKAGEELERIQTLHGGITAQKVVEESKPKNSVLHKCFEWNDATAAEKYRESQARVLVANIVVVKLEDGQEETEPVRAFINVVDFEEPDESKYVTLKTALSNDDYKSQMLQNALKELKSFQQKYKNLKGLSDVFNAIRKVSQ
jgi:hypothetical protein